MITYLDDLLILTSSGFKDQQLKLEMVLVRFSNTDMRFNVSKSKFFAEQIEYLISENWIVRQAVKPVHTKIDKQRLSRY
jgi:hypothetical protein